jgi:hypothetical protein
MLFGWKLFIKPPKIAEFKLFKLFKDIYDF